MNFTGAHIFISRDHMQLPLYGRTRSNRVYPLNSIKVNSTLTGTKYLQKTCADPLRVCAQKAMIMDKIIPKLHLSQERSNFSKSLVSLDDGMKKALKTEVEH